MAKTTCKKKTTKKKKAAQLIKITNLPKSVLVEEDLEKIEMKHRPRIGTYGKDVPAYF